MRDPTSFEDIALQYKRLFLSALVLVTSVVCGLSVAESVAQRWPAWRGDGTGLSADAVPPVHWDAETNVLWKTEIPGKGMSSPVVYGDRVYLTSGVEGEQREFFKKILRWTLGVLAIVLAAIYLRALLVPRPAAVAPSDPGEPLDRFLKMLSPLAIVLYFAGAVAIEIAVNGDGWARNWFAGSVARIWLASGVVGCGGLIAALLTVTVTSTSKWLISVFFFPSMLFFLFAMPDPRSYELNPSRVVEIGLFAFGCLVGVMLHTHRRWWWLGASLVIVVLLALSVAQLHLSGDQAYGHLRFRIIQGMAAGAVAAVCAAKLLVSSEKHKAMVTAPGKVSSIAANAVCCILFLMVVLQFYGTNFLLPQAGISRSLFSIDLNTGEVLWRAGYVAPEELLVAATSHATPTVAVDENHVYAYFGKTGIFAADFDGNIQWINRSLPLETHYGAATSPVVKDGVVFIVCDQIEQSYLVALDSQTGEVVWKTARDASPSFGTPMLASFEGHDQLVVAGGSTLSGYDLGTGEVLWTADIRTGHVVSSVVVIDDVAYVGGGYDNHTLKAFQAFENNGVEAGTQLWETEKRVLGYCSPLVIDGHVFVINNTGIVTCLDAATGEVKWRERLGGNYTASPMAANGNIYFQSKEGIVSVIEASPQFNLLATNDINESCVASPAAVGGKLLIRTTSHLWCFGAASAAK